MPEWSRADRTARPGRREVARIKEVTACDDRQMRAAVWDGPGEMHLGEVPDAACPPDGALLRVTACGICGTDVRAFYNGDRRLEPGAVLGHEICGEVLELGPEAEQVQFKLGDLVHVISTLYCGHCKLCRNGNEHLCQDGALMGFDFQG